MFKIGDYVEIIGLGIKGFVTDIRRGAHPTDGMDCDHDRPRSPLPDYVEIDGNIQVPPNKVRRA